MARTILLAIALTLATSAAYTQEEQDAALKNVEEMGMPVLGAFKKMTPKMLNTVRGASEKEVRQLSAATRRRPPKI